MLVNVDLEIGAILDQLIILPILFISFRALFAESVALPDEYQHTSTSRTNSLRKSQNMETDRLHKETRSKLMEEMTGVTNQPFIQPVILVVPTENVAAAIDAIKRGFRSTNEAAVQVHPFNFDPPIEKATVAVGMDQPSCFDFCAQANSSGSSFFYQTTAVGAATANASSSTEQPMLEFAQSSTFCYDAQQPPEQELQYVYSDGLVSETQVRHRTTSTNGQYLDDVYSGTPHVVAPSAPMARTFGTMVDEKVFTSNVSCVRNAETSMDGPEFDLLRDIETQTPWNDVGLMTEFWSDMGNSP
ncbi:hypothetical protein NECAME_06232 [Necator americanus]|uniref:Uncharacterized protein n=1 Tax=Necator americanus TaxID=51031 RepID=W2TXS0_NECAM|nr:hypothetical protein NECAME_06232 [Necator americanus]ETN85812.1 hypothetical protein NECAME_06232 [Necator americanus]